MNKPSIDDVLIGISPCSTTPICDDCAQSISDAKAQIRKDLEALRPERRQYDSRTVPKYLQPAEGENWRQALRLEQGYNEALDDFWAAILDYLGGDQDEQ